MNINEITISSENLKKLLEEAKGNPKMEFSKWLMLFAVILCGGTWVVAAVSWILWNEFPVELVQYTAWFFGALIAYMLKSGYENKSKIEKGQEGGSR